MEPNAPLKQIADQLRQQRMDPKAEPFLELMSDGFIWSDERLTGLSTEEMGSLRAIFRFRTSLITKETDTRFEKLWNELRKICPEWIGFHPSRCSPDGDLASRYWKSKKRSPLDILERLHRKSVSTPVADAKRQSAAITLLLKARNAITVPLRELDHLDAAFCNHIEKDQPEAALSTLEKIAEKIPCRGGFWRDLERAAFAMEMRDRANYFRGRFLSTKPGS